MVKKLFALASVTALGGLVAAVSAAGCTTTEVITQSSEGPADAGRKDSGNRPPPSTGDDEDPTDEDPVTCLTKDPIDVSELTYKPPRTPQSACPKDVGDVVSNYINTAAKPTWLGLRDEVAQKVSADCAACVFSNVKEPEWGPIVVDDNGAGTWNFGGCVQTVAQKEADCGKGMEQMNLCMELACESCDEDDQDAMSECIQASIGAKGPCGDVYGAAATACGGPGAISSAAQRCSTGLDMITVACISGGDGAPDAGADANGDDPEE